MAASNKNELPLNDLTSDESGSGIKPTVSADGVDEPSDEETTPATTIADNAITNDDASDILDDGEDTEIEGANDDPDFGANFQPAPVRIGEFFVPLSKLGEWRYHPKYGSRLFGAHIKALMLSAADPESLRAIVILPEADGIHPIVDGRFLWAAIKAANEGNEDIEVRCIMFDGNEKEAVAAVCDATLGTIGASAIEKAHALLSLTQTNGISRTAIANRYAGLTVSKVSNMLIAAKTKAAYPALFDILIEPDRAPISYGVELNKVRKTMGEAFQKVLDRAVDLAANGERCRPADAFDALQIERAVDADAPEPVAARAKPVVPISSEPIFGEDDVPVGAYERLADNIDRIRLPDVSAMSLAEREAAAEACIVQIRRHFGLDEQG